MEHQCKRTATAAPEARSGAVAGRLGHDAPVPITLGDMQHPDRSLVLPSAQHMEWIELICAQGVRRPGSEADEWTTNWIIEQFNEIGLADVRLEPVELPRWEPREWSLRVSSDRESLELPCFPLPHSAPAPDGLQAPIASEPGAFALHTITLNGLPQSLARHLALRNHDPDNEFDKLVQTLPFGREMQAVMEPAIDAGAIGFIGIFDAPWESCDYYVPYDAVARPIPGVWISRSSGERLQSLLKSGPVTARLVVDSVREPAVTHNVVGVLPGATDEWVIIGSHHDAPWASAVEDASGIALVLAQAHYWSRVAQTARPHNLLFLVTSGHMAHGAGTAAFIAQHKELLRDVVLEVHLEHPARECRGENGRLVPTDQPEVRWWFTSRIPSLLDSVEQAIQAEDLRRSLIMPPDVFGPHPTTDGGFFHTEGVPLVNFLTAPMYLFDSQDTPDKIHEPSLEPVTRAAARIIASTAGTTAAQLRQGVTEAG